MTVMNNILNAGCTKMDFQISQYVLGFNQVKKLGDHDIKY